MSRINLKNLTIKGFQSFASAAHLDFPDSGVVLVNGVNLDTKGSSGSGKTSLVGSIAYLFDYALLPATELRSWHSEEMEVVGVIDTDRGEAKITRGPGNVKLEIEGKTFRGTNADKEIQKLHGLPVAFLEPMTYRPQQKPGIPSGGFLGMGPTDKGKFLSKLLDLDRFELEFEKSKKQAETLEIRLETQRQALERAHKEKADAEKDISDLPNVDFGIDQAEAKVQKITAQLEESAKRIEKSEFARDKAQAEEAVKVREVQKKYIELEDNVRKSHPDLSDIETKLDLCKAKLDDVSKADKSNEFAFNVAYSTYRKELSTLYAGLSLLEKSESDLAELRLNLESIQNMACNVCKRPWDGPEQQLEGERIAANIATLERSLEAKQAMVEKIADLEHKVSQKYTPDPMIARLENIKNTLEKDIAIKRASWKSEQSKTLMSLRAEQRSEMDKIMVGSSAISNTLLKLRGVQNKLKLLLADAEKELALALEQKRSSEMVRNERNARIQRADLTIAELNGQILDTIRQLSEERDFAAIIGRTGYLGVIFEEVLIDISQRASAIMSTIPNVSHCSIKLSPVKTTKAGEKRAITPVIYINGTERPFQSCSGGMTNAITLAVDLALSQVISERTGTHLGWLILDECFDGMDPVTKESCLELLRDTAEAQNLLIFVIDHETSFKEMFDKVITIKFQDGKSWIDTRYSGEKENDDAEREEGNTDSEGQVGEAT